MRRLIFKILIIVLRLCQMLKGNWVWSIQDPLDYFCKSSVHSCMLRRFSRVQLFATLWTIALQAPLSMEFSRQEYCSGLPCPPPGDLPNPGIELASLPSPALAGRFFTASATWEVHSSVSITSFKKNAAVTQNDRVLLEMSISILGSKRTKLHRFNEKENHFFYGEATKKP